MGSALKVKTLGQNFFVGAIEKDSRFKYIKVQLSSVLCKSESK
jgi:hypothetical protein